MWNRISFKLKKKRVRNDRAMWIRADAAFPAIVDRPLFEAAQTIIRERALRMTDEDMLSALRTLFQLQGLLSGLISTDDEAYTYNKRINRLAAVQEHRMIMRAIERGA